MDMPQSAAWWNHKTGGWDNRSSPPQTDDEARQYIWQETASQKIYGIHRELGLDVLHALLETLKAQDAAIKAKRGE